MLNLHDKRDLIDSHNYVYISVWLNIIIEVSF